jgi:hypothetical protein
LFVMGFVALLCAAYDASAGWEGCAWEIAVVTDEMECSLDAVSDVGWRGWASTDTAPASMCACLISPVTSMLTTALSSCLVGPHCALGLP